MNPDTGFQGRDEIDREGQDSRVGSIHREDREGSSAFAGCRDGIREPARARSRLWPRRGNGSLRQRGIRPLFLRGSVGHLPKGDPLPDRDRRAAGAIVLLDGNPVPLDRRSTLSVAGGAQSVFSLPRSKEEASGPSDPFVCSSGRPERRLIPTSVACHNAMLRVSPRVVRMVWPISTSHRRFPPPCGPGWAGCPCSNMTTMRSIG